MHGAKAFQSRVGSSNTQAVVNLFFQEGRRTAKLGPLPQVPEKLV